jgi:class 3 adenylate cyclase/tetratricopeptide (TPR) repeat protein
MTFSTVEDIETALRSGEFGIRFLHSVWAQRRPIPDPSESTSSSLETTEGGQIDWLRSNISLSYDFTKRALEKEEYLLVCDAAREALRLWHELDESARINLVKVRMNYAAALTRLGFTREARKQLSPCIQDDFRPLLENGLKGDILLQLGDILREEAVHAPARAARQQTAQEALHFYELALEIHPHPIQALLPVAAMSLVLSTPGSDLRHRAKERARQVMRLVTALERHQGPKISTTHARAVAHTILGRLDTAFNEYRQLQELENVTVADLAGARYHAQFLAEAVGQARSFFKSAFPPLQLIVFAGHLPDPPGQQGRFPPELVEPVRKRLRAQLKKADARVGLVSAAAGADLLFIEALRERGGVVHVVLPWSQEEFRQTSVCHFEPPNASAIWAPLFDQAIRDAATVREIGQLYEPGSDVSWQFALEVTAGLAIHTARASRLDVQPMALWDELPGAGAGGTDSFVQFWKHQLMQEPIIVKMPAAQIRQDESLTPKNRSERAIFHQEVKSLLFADIVGYSKLTEKVIPEFVGVFLERVSQLLASSKYAPLSINTWGDAVYAVFDFAHDAGCFALELTKMIKDGEDLWKSRGLYYEQTSPVDGKKVQVPLNIRIGLHSGPVFMHYNPVLRQLGFTGAHVSRAARIEPVTRAGEVYASEEFAAMAELGSEIERQVDGNPSPEGPGFACEYAGSMKLAKGFPGQYRIYRVIPKRSLDIEELAKAIHELYCAKSKAKGQSPETNSAMRPWEELPEDLRDSNRAQAADIPNKLNRLGYELAPSHGLVPAKLQLAVGDVEDLAIREHDRWMNERRRNGWTYGTVRDNSRKHHPLLVPWDQLAEEERDKDRDAVRNLPLLIEKAGFRLRKLG